MNKEPWQPSKDLVLSFHFNPCKFCGCPEIKVKVRKVVKRSIRAIRPKITICCTKCHVEMSRSAVLDDKHANVEATLRYLNDFWNHGKQM